jgi:hypothetical protein
MSLMHSLSPDEIITILKDTYGDTYTYRNREPSDSSRKRYARFDNPSAHSIDVILDENVLYPIFQIWISHIHIGWDDMIGTIETGIGPIQISELNGDTSANKLKTALGLFIPTIHQNEREIHPDDDEGDMTDDEEDI